MSFALLLLFKSVDIQALSSYFLTRLPRKSIVVLLFFTGLLTLVVWLESPVSSLVQGQPPELLGNSTALVTHALDLAIIAASFVSFWHINSSSRANRISHCFSVTLHYCNARAWGWGNCNDSKSIVGWNIFFNFRNSRFHSRIYYPWTFCYMVYYSLSSKFA